MKEVERYRGAFNSNLWETIRVGTKLFKQFPASLKALTRALKAEQQASRRREKCLKEGLQVPPLLIISTTERCNLACAGCYASVDNAGDSPELSRARIDTLLIEARALGVGTVLLAGGEPLLSEHWLNALANQPDLLGLVFTNGTLLDSVWADWFSKQRSVIPLISIEGDMNATDARRGGGVYAKVLDAMCELRTAGVPFGISITTDRHNFDAVTADEFTAPYVELGCRLIVHVEYVPVDVSDEQSALTGEQKLALERYCKRGFKERGALFIAFPGDEGVYGGCLAAGRGFLHISAKGALEPCPFAPYSDRNIIGMSLKEALKSPLLSYVRDNSEMLHESVGGCALRTQGELLSEFTDSRSS